jgi:hypothetical protein
MARLSKSELEALGGAFAHGYEAARAKRLYQEGLGATDADDLSLALGFPMLVELGPDVDDPGTYARERIQKPLRLLEPWPKNAAVRAARAIAATWDDFPGTLTAAALAGLERTEGLSAGDVRGLLESYFALPPFAWFHMLELVFLLEALVGGEAALEAALDLMSARSDEWTVFDPTRRVVVLAWGYVFDRLSVERQAGPRKKLEALLDAYRKIDPGLTDAARVQVASRAADLVLNGREGYVRSASRTPSGPDRNFDAFFLDAASFRDVTVQEAPLPAHASPSVQWLVQGGAAALQGVGDWSKVTFKGSKEIGQRDILGNWSRAASPFSAQLLVDMYARSQVKDEVVRQTRRGLARLAPLIRAFGDAADTAPKLKKAAKALLAAATPS